MAASGVDVLHTGAHSASIFDLSRSMGEGVPIVDFCIPCNPYFPTPEMFDELTRDLRKILKHYPSDASTITAKLSSVLGLHPQTVAMANGSTELITWIDHLLIKSSVAVPIPTFGRWTDQPLETGKRVDMFPLRERDNFKLDLDEYVQFIRERGSRVAVVCNVNNPDGGYLNRRDVIRFMDDLADLDLVIIDESFIDFSDAEQYPSVGPEAVIRSNVVVLKSLGKNFGLHGIRFGYLMANPAIAGRIAKALPKWNLNSLAEKVVFMIEDHQDDYAESLRLLSRDRRSMAAELSQLDDLKVFPSQGNFILVKLQPEWSGVELRDYLVADHAVYTRECGNKLGMTSQFMRLVVRPAADVDRLIDGIEDYGEKLRAESANEPWSTTGPSWSNGPSSTAAPLSPAPWSAGERSRSGGGPAHAARSESRPERPAAPARSGARPAPGPDDSRPSSRPVSGAGESRSGQRSASGPDRAGSGPRSGDRSDSSSRSDSDRTGSGSRSLDGPDDSWTGSRADNRMGSSARGADRTDSRAADLADESPRSDRSDSRRDDAPRTDSWTNDRSESRAADRPRADSWSPERPLEDPWADDRPPVFRPASRSADEPAGPSRSADRTPSGSRSADDPRTDSWPTERPATDPWSAEPLPSDQWPTERLTLDPWSDDPRPSAGRADGPPQYSSAATRSSSSGRSGSRPPTHADPYADEPAAEPGYDWRQRMADDEPDDLTARPPRRGANY
jgi:histidinol-phosphate/aromatic aminotransferase/cobyric acid decarboxylase-like protein